VGWAIDRAVGLPGLWFTYLVTYGCGAALQAAYYFGVWRKKPVRKLV
jgi:hypothetical protein